MVKATKVTGDLINLYCDLAVLFQESLKDACEDNEVTDEYSFYEHTKYTEALTHVQAAINIMRENTLDDL